MSANLWDFFVLVGNQKSEKKCLVICELADKREKTGGDWYEQHQMVWLWWCINLKSSLWLSCRSIRRGIWVGCVFVFASLFKVFLSSLFPFECCFFFVFFFVSFCFTPALCPIPSSLSPNTDHFFRYRWPIKVDWYAAQLFGVSGANYWVWKGDCERHHGLQRRGYEVVKCECAWLVGTLAYTILCSLEFNWQQIDYRNIPHWR